MSFLKTIFKKKTENLAETSDVLSKLNYESGTLFAEDNTNKVYVDIEELGGFSYLKTVILGEVQANIKRLGCTLTFIFENDTVTLNSDNTTVESNPIKNTRVNFTSIDFELSEEQAKKIKENKAYKIAYNLKDKEYRFDVIE